MIIETTVEDLGRGGLRLRQLKDGFRFGTDSVLLAWFAASMVRRRKQPGAGASSGAGDGAGSGAGEGAGASSGAGMYTGASSEAKGVGASSGAGSETKAEYTGGKSKPVRLLELGSGCGGAALLTLARTDEAALLTLARTEGAALLTLARTEGADLHACAGTGGAHIDCVEIMERPFTVLENNIRDNGLENRMRAFRADIRQLPDEVRRNQYDVVFMNPPFFKRSQGQAVPEGKKERLAGRFEENGGLEDFVRTASARLVPSAGFAVMVMKCERMAETMELYLRHGLKPVRLMTVHDEANKNASMFLIAGLKTSAEAELKVLPPLIMHRRDENGGIIDTEKLTEIYNKEHTDCFIL